MARGPAPALLLNPFLSDSLERVSCGMLLVKLRRLALRHAAERALHDYLALQSLDNVRLSLDVEPPVVDLRSGKLREVIAADHA